MGFSHIHKPLSLLPNIGEHSSICTWNSWWKKSRQFGKNILNLFFFNPSHDPSYPVFPGLFQTFQAFEILESTTFYLRDDTGGGLILVDFGGMFDMLQMGVSKNSKFQQQKCKKKQQLHLQSFMKHLFAYCWSIFYLKQAGKKSVEIARIFQGWCSFSGCCCYVSLGIMMLKRITSSANFFILTLTKFPNLTKLCRLESLTILMEDCEFGPLGPSMGPWDPQKRVAKQFPKHLHPER